MLTTKELNILIPLIDAGIKAAGLQVFQQDGGIHIQSALAKLQQMAEEAANTEKKGQTND
jgi:hypothetical protein